MTDHINDDITDAMIQATVERDKIGEGDCCRCKTHGFQLYCTCRCHAERQWNVVQYDHNMRKGWSALQGTKDGSTVIPSTQLEIQLSEMFEAEREKVADLVRTLEDIVKEFEDHDLGGECWINAKAAIRKYKG
jgi:hypothetical protein